MANENKRRKIDLDMSATVVPETQMSTTVVPETQDLSADLIGELMGLPRSKFRRDVGIQTDPTHTETTQTQTQTPKAGWG